METCLLYVTIVTSLWSIGIEGTFHEPSVQKISAPTGLPNNALFGYSIAYQTKTKRIIVSAPQASPVGQVFECQNNLLCKDIISDQIKKEPKPLTNMWLGATVATGSNFTVACAPRSIKLAQEKTGTFGKCYVSSISGGNTTELPSLTDMEKEKQMPKSKVRMPIKYELYMDSFGWSINVGSHDHIVVGGPAMNMGRAIVYSSNTANPRLLPNNVNMHPVSFNYGYSVTTGRYLPTNGIIYAISSPYGRSGYGKVTLVLDKFSWYLDDPKDHSPKVGSLFGSSLCSAKLSGSEGLDALLVGASLYATDGKVDAGAVYIYEYDLSRSAADYPLQIVNKKTILGVADRARFGSAIINLGDLNGDTRDEVAISAPYENDGWGSVYIYSAVDVLGDRPADKVPYLQKLQPERLSTIGYSMVPYQFQDNSPCNGLAIGAPESNTVLLYNCIPKIVVRVQKLQDDPRRIRPNNSIFNFESCVDIEYPSTPATIKAEIEVRVTLTHQTARIVGDDKEDSMKYTISTLGANKKKSFCSPVTIYLPEEGSYEPSIQYRVSATQIKPPTKNSYFDNTHALLSDISTLSLINTLWVGDCAGDKICKPILTANIDTSMPDTYMIGSSDSEHVTITVHNTGDPAYTACVRVRATNLRVRRWPAGCKRVDQYQGVCYPDRPIKKNASWNVNAIELETKSLRSDLTEVVFTIDLYEQCSSTNSTTKSKKINLTTDPNGLLARGYTNIGDIINLSYIEIDETGKQLSHIYTVSNRGVTTWVNVSCYIVMDKKPYFKGLFVTIDTQARYKCDENVVDKNGQYSTMCYVDELKKSQKFDVIASFYIEPKTIDWKNLEQSNMTLTSYFKVGFGEKELTHSITSLLRKKESAVPLWIIIVAALVGLFIMFIIAFILYECGFLRRKNKEKLESLRRSVYRQSIRRSAIERESKRSANQALDQQSDKKQLIEESDSSDPSTPTSSCTDKPIPQVEKPPRVAKENIQQTLKEVLEVPPNFNESEIELKTPADGEKIKKELIILGLQKNLGKYPNKPPKPSIQKTLTDNSEDQKIDKNNF